MKITMGAFLISAAMSILLVGAQSKTYAAETVVYSEGFESGDGGYVLDLGTSAEWQWGTPSGAVGPATAHSGTRCWGTNLAGQLSRPAEGSIVSPAIALPSITADQLIRVRFWAFVAIDGMQDRGQFFVSKDGASWQSLIQLYQNMDTSAAASPTWRKYEFTLDPSYAGGNIYLRFRAAVDEVNPSFYCDGSTDLSGLYVDDVAISVLDASGTRKTFSLEAWEDTSDWASCPWVAPWDGGEFKADNDIFSVARGLNNEYTDYYRLMKPLVARDGVYPLEVQELENEDSFTDFLALLQVDHAADVAVAPSDTGALVGYEPSNLLPPVSAVTATGLDVRELVSGQDDDGYAAYGGDAVVVDFGNVDISAGAALVLRVKGFVFGDGAEKPFTGPPAVIVQTRDSGGNWQERGRLRPRYDYSVAAFDLSSSLGDGQPAVVRLVSVSHSTKYHSIDFVGLHAGSQPAFTVTQVAPGKASFGATDILSKLTAADGDRVEISSGEKFSAEFPVVAQAPQSVRDFVLIAKGYYVPKSGSYLIYTWDGAAWALRDAFSYPESDYTRDFDLSLFLPDPDGEYKVRVWQDYQYEPAGINSVAMTEAGSPLALKSAWDYRYDTSIMDEVGTSDSSYDSWQYCPRNRVTEFAFTASESNVPPGVCPVEVSSASKPEISWTYSDLEAAPQAASEIQIWTGPGATGTIVWNPPVFYDANTSVVYSGPSLASGVYYVLVRASDGNAWGPWCEGSFDIEGCPGTCGDPAPSLGKITAVDAGFILRASVGLVQCAACICDLDSSGAILANDALADLRYAVGLPQVLDCPDFSVTTTTTMPPATTTTVPF